MSRTLEQIFEDRGDKFSDIYEVVRTVGFKIQCKSGVKECRLEVIREPSEKNHRVRVWEQDYDQKSWKRTLSYEQPTLAREDPGDALNSAIDYLDQYMTRY